jgi:Na+/H+ antiporter NhaC
MSKFEMNAVENGDLFTVEDANSKAADAAELGSDKGVVMDLVFPVLVLVVSCVLGMIYTGGFFGGTGFVEAFSASDASVGLSMGGLIALFIIIIYYLCRRTISFKDCMGCIPEGMQAMVPPILVLTLAWSLKAMTDSLGLADYVSGLVEGMQGAAVGIIPAGFAKFNLADPVIDDFESAVARAVKTYYIALQTHILFHFALFLPALAL